MSLFKPYRIKRHNLIFTRIEAFDDEYIYVIGVDIKDSVDDNLE